MNKHTWLMSLAVIAGTASAQESPPGQLEEVTVTAERRAENIRDVPSSISTVSGEDLDVLSTGGQDVRLLAARVPSLNVESSFGRAFPRFYIRGYGNGDFRLNASQPVSLIYDDVVQENPILKGFPIFDLDQIEVLRGPQGTLFGRNTPGGVVKFDSVKPASEFGGYVNVSDATFNTANVEGAINVPLRRGLVGALFGALPASRRLRQQLAHRRERHLRRLRRSRRAPAGAVRERQFQRAVQRAHAQPGRHRAIVPRQHHPARQQRSGRWLRSRNHSPSTATTGRS